MDIIIKNTSTNTDPLLRTWGKNRAVLSVIEESSAISSRFMQHIGDKESKKYFNLHKIGMGEVHHQRPFPKTSLLPFNWGLWKMTDLNRTTVEHLTIFLEIRFGSSPRLKSCKNRYIHNQMILLKIKEKEEKPMTQKPV